MCVKNIVGFFLCIVNFAMLLMGAAVLIVGALLQWGADFLTRYLSPALAAAGQGAAAGGYTNTSNVIFEVNNYMGQYYKFLGSAGIIIFITGCVITIIAALGFIGACCRFKILLTVYVVLVGIILVVFTILVIVFLANRSNLQKWGAENLQKAISSEYAGIDQPSGISRLFDTLQARLGCCGVLNYTDFYSASKWNRTYILNGQVYKKLTPVACCVMKGVGFTPLDNDCPISLNSTINNYQKPCYPLLWDLVNQYNNYVIYAMLGTITVLAILLFLTVWLIKMAAEDDLTCL
jgi:hypothetical protein